MTQETSPTSVEDALVEIIGAHEPWAGGWQCSCQESDEDGTHQPLPVSWDRHFAAVLAAYVAADRAQVWDEGYEAGDDDSAYAAVGTGPHEDHANPYRAVLPNEETP